MSTETNIPEPMTIGVVDEWKMDPVACIHHTIGPGPRCPARWGSLATVVCVGCGKWVLERDYVKPYKSAIKWCEASELLINIAIDNGPERAAP